MIWQQPHGNMGTESPVIALITIIRQLSMSAKITLKVKNPIRLKRLYENSLHHQRQAN